MADYRDTPVDDNPHWIIQAFEHCAQGSTSPHQLADMAAEWVQQISPYAAVGAGGVEQLWLAEVIEWSSSAPPQKDIRKWPPADFGHMTPERTEMLLDLYGVSAQTFCLLGKQVQEMATLLRTARCAPSGSAKRSLSARLHGGSVAASELADIVTRYVMSGFDGDIARESLTRRSALVRLCDDCIDPNPPSEGRVIVCADGHWSPPYTTMTDQGGDELVRSARALPFLLRDRVLPLIGPATKPRPSDPSKVKVSAAQLVPALETLSGDLSGLSQAAFTRAVAYPVRYGL